MKVKTFMAIYLVAGFGVGYVYGSHETARIIGESRIYDIIEKRSAKEDLEEN